jgi:hypothetical protein
MPQIREYNRQVEAVAPVQGRQVSAQALGGDGQALEFAGKALGHIGDVYERIKEQDDAVKISKQTSELYLQQTQELEALKNSGKITDPNAFTEYKQKFDNAFSKIGDEVSTSAGQKLLAERQATYTQHFGNAFVKSSADAKGTQTKLGMQTTLNNFSTGLFNNPNDISHAMGEWEASVDAVQKSGTISYEDAITIKQHGQKTMADSAARGLIDKDPNAAKAILSTDVLDKYMDGNRKAELMKSAEIGIEGLRTEKKRAEADIAAAKEKAAEAEMHSYMPDWVDNKLLPSTVVKSKTLSSDQQIKWLKLINTNAAGLAKNHDAVENDLYKKITIGEITSVDQINDMVGNGINSKGAQRLAKMLADRRDPETGVKDSDAKAGIYKQAEKALGKDPLAGANPDAERRLNAFRFRMEEAWIDGKKQGLTTQQLTDPRSPNYLGNLINEFKPTREEVFQMKFGQVKDKALSGSTGIAVNQTPPPATLKVGDVRNGFRYNGGKPSDKANWEKVK